MPHRRPRRGVTPAERDLWRTVARTITPLRDDPEGDAAGEASAAPVAPQPALSDGPSAPAAGSARPAAGLRAPMPAPRGEPLVAVDVAPDPVAAAGPDAIGGRLRRARLARGKLLPEGRLDLHGLTQDAAHAALIRFVREARERGKRHVLVITGKGRPDRTDAIVPERHGVLRHRLPHWIAAPPLLGQVVEMRQAHPRHGGAGAVYLFLRRKG
jgi:DNA-nicking Smr family endonuclease